MVSSDASTPEAYVDEIEDDERRELVTHLRELINSNLADGFVESMRWGMITWEIPLDVSGPTYNGEPLGGVALANQKHHVSVYLMAVYGDPDVARRFEERWKASNPRLDRGKSCVRLRRRDDLVEVALVEAVAATDLSQILAAADAR